MKLIIAGGRDWVPAKEDYDRMSALIKQHGVTEIVSGCATGADRFGEDVARRLGLPVKRFRAEWGRYGLVAGPIRNAAMAEYADAVVLLPGGKGTASMRAEAIKAGKPILFDSGAAS